MNTKTLILGAALAGILLSASCGGAEPMQVKMDGKCMGVNACKGKGACTGKGHSCAGKNSCKGKGWIKSTQSECKEKGGTYKT